MSRSVSRIARTAVVVGKALVLLGVLAFARPAHADIDEFGAYNRSHERGQQFESPQHLALELRVGRYIPSVDDEFASGDTPYKTMFGNSNRYAIGFEIDWQAFRVPHVGTLGAGFGFSYTKSTAFSFQKNSTERSGEKTGLTIFPMYAVAVFRADFLARETPIPLVGYAKFGVGAAPWRVTNGGGTAQVGNVSGNGLSDGFQFALGGMVLLDPLDPYAAMQLDNETGINNSYVFIEWYESKLNGFGSGGQMQVGTNTWVLGLAFEM